MTVSVSPSDCEWEASPAAERREVSPPPSLRGGSTSVAPLPPPPVCRTGPDRPGWGSPSPTDSVVKLRVHRLGDPVGHEKTAAGITEHFPPLVGGLHASRPFSPGRTGSCAKNESRVLRNNRCHPKPSNHAVCAWKQLLCCFQRRLCFISAKCFELESKQTHEIVTAPCVMQRRCPIISTDSRG